MWTPTHVQMTVHRARNLIPKGKNGTNDAYVTISLGKEKYQTSVKEKSESPEWNEECDLPIPNMESCLVLNCFHRNLLGLDEFLGHVSISLEQFQIYERPKSRWYSFRNKPNSKKAQKYRGEIEVKVTFVVQSLSQSELGLNNKVRRSGSFRSLANSVGDKIHHKMERRKSKTEDSSDTGDSLSQLSKHETLKPTKSSPAKLEKRRRSVSHEVLATTPSFDRAIPINIDDHSQTDSSSTQSRRSSSNSLKQSNDSINNITPKKQVAPPKPPRSSLKELKPLETCQSTSCPTDELTKDFSLTKLQGSPKQYRSKENLVESDFPDCNNIKSPGETEKEDKPALSHISKDNIENLTNSEHSLTSKSDSHDGSMEEEDYFSRTNSFRQAIQRGSMRKSGGKRNRPQNDTNKSPLLTGGRRTYTDSDPSIDTLPEETSTPVTTPIFEDNQQRSISYLFTDTGEDDAQIGILGKTKEKLLKSKSTSALETEVQSQEIDSSSKDASPKLRVKQSKQDPTRRHTLGHGLSELPKMSTHNIHQTIQDAKKAGDIEKQQILPNDVLDRFKEYDREDLIKTILSQKKEIDEKNVYAKDLEQYIDNLLVRVIEYQPKILQTPFTNSTNSTMSQVQHNRSHSNPVTTGMLFGNNYLLQDNHQVHQPQPPQPPRVIGHPNYPPPAYTNNMIVTQNNNRNLVQQQPNNSFSRSKISPPKVIKAGQNNKKEKKSSNPFKKFLKA